MESDSFFSNIIVKNFTYSLPKEKIAQFPVSERDKSRLLIYKNDRLYETSFDKINETLPKNSLLLLNDTKVIYARLLFPIENKKPAEIFCLEPAEVQSLSDSPNNSSQTVWNCLLGNVKKPFSVFRKELVVDNCKYKLVAKILGKKKDVFIVSFNWHPTGISFGEILEHAGQIPLPPYIKREATEPDKNVYQTIYASHSGSVAAPTAGLHFTTSVLESLKNSGTDIDYMTLHVGAGTFKPMKADSVSEHKMHYERFSVPISVIEKIAGRYSKIICTGTTTTRTIESLYLFGVKLFDNPELILKEADISQWEAYGQNFSHTRAEVFRKMFDVMRMNNMKFISGKTSLMIIPGFRFRVTDCMITNFHQPGSSLLLLVSAFIGDDWRKIYKYALENNFRFLSYGDTSLLFRKDE